MSIRNKAFLMAAGAALLVSTAARADILTFTWTGTVHREYFGIGDQLGLFGPVGSDPAGKPYTAVFNFDTSLGSHVVTPATPARNYASDQIFGGHGTLYSDPFIGGSVTIDGHTLSLTGLSMGSGQIVYTDYSAGGGSQRGLQVDYSGLSSDGKSVSVGFFILNAGGGIPGFETAFSHSVAPGDVADSYLSVDDYAHLNPDGSAPRFDIKFDDNWAPIQLTNVTLTVESVASGVPEPSTWAMMLIGFGGLGFASARRKRLAAA